MARAEIPFIGGAYDGAGFLTNGGAMPDKITLDKPIHPEEKYDVDPDTKRVKRIKCLHIGTVTYLQEWLDPDTRSALVDVNTARPFFVVEENATKIKIPED